MIRTDNLLLDYFSKNSIILDRYSLQVEVFKPRQTIIHQEKFGRYVHIIKEGIAKCFVEEANGKEFVQEFFGEGKLLGEIEALTSTESFSNVMALSSVRTYSMKKDDFLSMVENEENVGLMVSRAIANKLRDTAVRASLQQSYTIEYCLKELLEFQNRNSISINKRDIANYLGITVRSLNRTMKSIEQI